MSLTRGNVIDRVVGILGDTSPEFRTFLETSFNNVLFSLWGLHDWDFKHKNSTFTTVIGTADYDLSVGTTDLRSVNDIEVMYDKTQGRPLIRCDLRDIRKSYPKEDQVGQPANFAAWNVKTVTLSPTPNVVSVMNFLYTSKPVLPTADADDLETDVGLPDYVQYLAEKMLLAEGMLWYDDNRREAMLTEIERIWLPKAIQEDMRHLESSARFKFWEEEICPSMPTMDGWLRRTWWGDN